MLLLQHDSIIGESGCGKGFYKSLADVDKCNEVLSLGYGSTRMGWICIGCVAACVPVGVAVLFCLFAAARS